MPSQASEAEMKMAREIAGRFYQGIRDHDYAKWVLDGHKDNTTGVQIALAAIQATRSIVAEEGLRDLREKVTAHFRLYEGDPRGDAFSIVLSEIDAILSQQEPEYSGWVEVVDEGEA